MEKYVQWKPFENIPEELLFLESLTASPEGLVIALSDMKSLRFKIDFSFARAYRNIFEEYRLSLWSHFHKEKQGSGSLWIVKNSDWLDQLYNDGLIQPEIHTHYLIITGDDCVDVITENQPAIFDIESFDGSNFEINKRVLILQNLIEFNMRVDILALCITTNELTSDCDSPLVQLNKQHITNVLTRYIAGELTSNDVEKWANLIEGCDDINYDKVGNILYCLANPLITYKLTPATAQQYINQLMENKYSSVILHK